MEEKKASCIVDDADASVLERGEEFDGSEAQIITTLPPGDPDLPFNYPLKKRILYTLILVPLYWISSMSSSILTPGVPYLEQKYNVSPEVAELSMALVLVGYAIGPMIWSPVAEAWGRRWQWTPPTILFVIFQIPVGIEPNFQTVLVVRFLQGLFGSASIIGLGSSMADIWPPDIRGVIFGINAFAIYAAPCFGPLLGSFFMRWVNFGWLSWIILILGGVFTILLHFIVPETYLPIIVKKRAQKLRSEGKNVKAAIEVTPLTLRIVIVKYLYRPFQMCFEDKALWFLCLYTAISYGLVYGFFVAMPIAFGEIRDFDSVLRYVPNIAVMIGVGFSTALLILTNKRFQRIVQEAGKVVPEARLDNLCIAAVIYPIGLFIFGWTGAYSHVHWIGPCIGGAITGFCAATIFMVSMLYIVDSFHQYSASGIAANGILRALAAVLIVMVMRIMIDKMTFQGTMSFFGGIAILIAPGPFILRSKGARWRKRSKWANPEQ